MGSIFVSIFVILAVSVSAQAKRYYCEVKGIEKELLFSALGHPSFSEATCPTPARPTCIALTVLRPSQGRPAWFALTLGVCR